jgi:hypothetical protein
MNKMSHGPKTPIETVEYIEKVTVAKASETVDQCILLSFLGGTFPIRFIEKHF